MRVTLNMPDVLIEQLLEVSEEKTRSGAIRLAVKDFIRRKKRERFLSLRNQRWSDMNWDEIEDPELFEVREREKSWRSH